MPNLNLAFSFTPTPGFATGTVVGGYVVTVTGTAPGNATPVVQTLPASATSATFPVIADTYTYSVQNIDGASPPNPLSASVNGTFTVTGSPTTVTLSLVSSVTASQS